MLDRPASRPALTAAGAALLSAVLMAPVRVFVLEDPWGTALLYSGLFAAVFFGITYLMLRRAR